MNQVLQHLHHAATSINLLGVLVIVFGVACGLARFVRAEVAAVRGLNALMQRQELRHALGYYLLLGLEFLIAADIIETLINPSTDELIVLGAVVAIRSVISYSLTSELAQRSTGEVPIRKVVQTDAVEKRAVS